MKLLCAALLALALSLPTLAAEPARTFQLSHSGYGLCTTWPTMQQGHMGWVTDMHCVTNASGAPDMDGLFVIDGSPAKLVRAEGDLALLSGGPGGRVLPFQIAKTMPAPGEDVVLLGRPLGGPQVIFRGWLSAVGVETSIGTQTVLQVPSAPGGSGSVVLNTRGLVIGIVQGAPCARGVGFCAVSLATPLEQLRAFLKLS